ncbi:MAG: hypothetical protein JNK64_02655 [Myxococcales bacterium]|nr:hypothetical protein [Myxococcales bacterium]
MAMVEVGIRIDLVKGVAFFGIEAVNQRIAAGGRVIEVRPAGAILTKVGAEEDDERVALGGCQFHVVFEDA